MKKVLAVILAFVMIFTFSVSAFAAVSSVQAPIISADITADLPKIVETTLEVKTLEELTEEEQAVYEEAILTLPEAVPTGMTVRYLNEVSASEEFTASITLDLHIIEDFKAKQLVNDEWVDVVVTQNDDVYSVTLTDNVSVVSFKLDEETNRPIAQLINNEWKDIDDLGDDEEIYTIVVSNSYPASVTISLENIEDACAKQFVDGKWIDVEMVKNPDGTYTITVNGPGFVAILTE